MVAYAGVVAIVYLAFFKTKYKRLISEQTDANPATVPPPSSSSKVEQDYTPGHSIEPSAPILDNQEPPDTKVTHVAKF